MNCINIGLSNVGLVFTMTALWLSALVLFFFFWFTKDTNHIMSCSFPFSNDVHFFIINFIQRRGYTKGLKAFWLYHCMAKAQQSIKHATA